MRKQISVADWLIELSTAAFVIGLYFFGKISLGLAVLGIVLCLSITLPNKRGRIARRKARELR